MPALDSADQRSPAGNCSSPLATPADGRHCRTLDDDQLAALQAAWANPQAVTEQLNEHTENECTEGGDGTAIYAGTDRSDIVRMFWSPCGYLVWDSWKPGENAAIPITLEELGLR